MKEISGIATEEESFFKDRQTWNRCHVCNSKKEKNMKTLEKTLTLSFIFFMKEHCCQRISVQYNQFIAQTLLTQTDVAPNLESFCTHSTCLLWLVHSSKLSFHGPFEKDFPPLFFFFPHRDLISCSHTLSLYHSRNRLWFAPPASPCSEDEGSEPPLPIPCMLPLPRG